jgi:hypothetical protein
MTHGLAPLLHPCHPNPTAPRPLALVDQVFTAGVVCPDQAYFHLGSCHPFVCLSVTCCFL